jgi:hypothetical protein
MKAVSGCQAKTKQRKTKCFSKKYIAIMEVMEKVPFFVIPAKAGIQNCLKILDSGSRFACPE